MHHSDSPGESPGSRRMSHPSVFGSDDHQTSPHLPPHSLSLQPAGTQVKKKSGFQITSVLPAQVSSASANNSIAEDTESYDDMDESHTEDLSSSDILDVSVSRATDTGVPERSSSEETLNSLQGGETPGVTSPNEPVMQQGYLVNGVHHHHKTGRPAAPSAIPAVPQAPASSGRSVQAAEAGGSAAPVPDAARAPVPTVMPVAPANPPTASAATTASRFRVVKLDSNTEPFRKGRWTCTEFYEKDAPAGDVAAVAHRAVESVVQSEHETTSGSSSGSTLSGGGDVHQVCAGLHAQDPGALLLPQPSVLLGVESSSASVRPYSVEPQSNYPANTKPPVSVSQSALPPVEYTPRPASVQPAAQPLQIPPAQSAVSPRAVPGLPPVAVSPRPQVPGPQMSINPDQTGAQLFSSAALSHLQPLLLRAPLLPAGPAYVTASQLEDAQRLLLQHHPLLSLPRLAAGGMAGLAGPAASDAAAAVSTGADEDSSSGASVVAIDNKIEQAMDLVKSHLMFAVREEVEVLKEQIKELMERNSQLEQENSVLKNLASPEQLAQFQAQVQTGSPTAGAPPEGPGPTA
ncbi:TSC22 domain family protein 1-like isoform X2 [Sinocyclocheilus rhinocerous]|uniref:TSC22 domain family protein 1-like isoform X2 n=1 Tax=Sinocyclocheilus rhinocerous TaxID=307959 RepID=UPI0007B81CCD|nr:PREDICTED: TSC22 domain family protein 1-like isoform X2 [Sinocyclocheilus rhinocerous]